MTIKVPRSLLFRLSMYLRSGFVILGAFPFSFEILPFFPPHFFPYICGYFFISNQLSASHFSAHPSNSLLMVGYETIFTVLSYLVWRRYYIQMDKISYGGKQTNILIVYSGLMRLQIFVFCFPIFSLSSIIKSVLLLQLEGNKRIHKRKGSKMWEVFFLFFNCYSP